MRLFEGTKFDIPPRCDRCDQLESECKCPPPAAPPPNRIPPEQQTARIVIERRKRGKVVTVVRGLPADGNDLPDIVTRLKSVCGAGGTVKGDTIEVQGEHQARIQRVLTELGYRVKS